MSLFGGNDNGGEGRIRYYGALARGNGPWELHGSPRILHPFPDRTENADLIIIEREYVGKPDIEYKIPLDTADETFKDAFLVSQEEVRRRAGLVYFRRVFSQIPADHSEYSSTSYTYPEYRSTFFDFADTIEREALTRTTNLRISYKYYQTEDPETDIELETAFQPMNGDFEVDFVNDPSGTVPTYDEYVNMVTNKTWIRAEDDVFERWRGNIWRRVRKEVVAQ